MPKKYVCMDCGRRLIYAEEPKYCPNCGGANMVLDRRKSRVHAENCIAKCQEMLPALEASYAEFIQDYVVYEDLMQTLRVYKNRGVVTEEELPKLFKPTLSQSLKEYRASKGEKKENGENAKWLEIANSSPFPQGMTQAEYFGLVEDKENG